jgi:hypothetical protein
MRESADVARLDDAYIEEVQKIIDKLNGTEEEQYRRMSLHLLLDIRERLEATERNPLVRFGSMLQRDPVFAILILVGVIMLILVYMAR